jgi:hypothetical protein
VHPVLLLLAISPKARELMLGVDWGRRDKSRRPAAAAVRRVFRLVSTMPYAVGCWVFISPNEGVTLAFVDSE